MTEVPSTGHAVPGQSKKVCFVTIGATASFDSLLKAVLATPFLEALRDAKYTDLIIQHGKDKGKAIYDEFMSTQSASIKQSLGLETTGFDFKTNGLDQEMQRVKGDPQSGDEEGLVVSHAGWNYQIIVELDMALIIF